MFPSATLLLLTVGVADSRPIDATKEGVQSHVVRSRPPRATTGDSFLCQTKKEGKSFDAGFGAKKDGKKDGTKDADSAEDRERRAVWEKAEALAQLGPKGVAELTAKLLEGPTVWKYAALGSLRTFGPDAAPALDAVTAELSSREMSLRLSALETLAAIGPKAKSAIPAVVATSSDTSDFRGAFRAGGPSTVAEAALRAVESIDPAAKPKLAETMIPSLLKVIEKGDPAPIDNALRLLRELGSDVRSALPSLTAGLSDLPDRSLRDVLPIYLAAGEDGMKLLADLMLDPKTPAATKRSLMSGYRWQRSTTPSSIRILRGMLQEKSPELRVAALETLSSLPAKELIPELVERLPEVDLLKVPSDYLGQDSFYAARALARQGKDAVPELTKALRHPVALARFQAARALADIGKDAASALGALGPLLKDGNALVEIEAAKAILKIDPADPQAEPKTRPEAMAKLEEHLKPDAKLLGAALQTIREIGRGARPLAPAVKKLALEARTSPLQQAGLDALRGMKADPADIVAVWMKCVKGNPAFLTFPPEEELRADADAAKSCIPQLVKYLENGDVNQRRRVTEVLKAMVPAARDAMPALIKALDDDSFVSSGALDALAEFGVDARPAVPAIVARFEGIAAREAAGTEREGGVSSSADSRRSRAHRSGRGGGGSQADQVAPRSPSSGPRSRQDRPGGEGRHLRAREDTRLRIELRQIGRRLRSAPDHWEEGAVSDGASRDAGEEPKRRGSRSRPRDVARSWGRRSPVASGAASPREAELPARDRPVRSPRPGRWFPGGFRRRGGSRDGGLEGHGSELVPSRQVDCRGNARGDRPGRPGRDPRPAEDGRGGRTIRSDRRASDRADRSQKVGVPTRGRR